MKEWAYMWGAKVNKKVPIIYHCQFTMISFVIKLYKIFFQVKLRNDMPDDMLKDAIETSQRILDECVDFEADGKFIILLIY